MRLLREEQRRRIARGKRLLLLFRHVRHERIDDLLELRARNYRLTIGSRCAFVTHSVEGNDRGVGRYLLLWAGRRKLLHWFAISGFQYWSRIRLGCHCTCQQEADQPCSNCSQGKSSKVFLDKKS